MIPTAKIVGPVCVGFLMFAIVFGFIDRERHAQMPQTDVAVVNAAAAQMEESQVVADGTTSLTIVVPNWFAWVIVGGLVVSTGLTIINIRLRWQEIRSMRGSVGHVSMTEGWHG